MGHLHVHRRIGQNCPHSGHRIVLNGEVAVGEIDEIDARLLNEPRQINALIRVDLEMRRHSHPQPPRMALPSLSVQRRAHRFDKGRG